MSNLCLMRLAVVPVLILVCEGHPAQAQAFDTAERCRAITALHRAGVEITSAKLLMLRGLERCATTSTSRPRILSRSLHIVGSKA